MPLPELGTGHPRVLACRRLPKSERAIFRHGLFGSLLRESAEAESVAVIIGPLVGGTVEPFRLSGATRMIL